MIGGRLYLGSDSHKYKQTTLNVPSYVSLRSESMSEVCLSSVYLTIELGREVFHPSINLIPLYLIVKHVMSRIVLQENDICKYLLAIYIHRVPKLLSEALSQFQLSL